jgi:hypothetical protein
MAVNQGWFRSRNRDADGKVQTFRSATAAVVWVVWLLFAVANWVDLAVQGRDHTSAEAAAVLLLATGIAYVTAQRPRIVADEAGVTIRNPFRDHRIGWALVTKIDLADLLRVHYEGPAQSKPARSKPAQSKPAESKPSQSKPARSKNVSSWAVHYSRRRQYSAENKARRAARPGRMSFGVPSGAPRSASYSAAAVSPPEAEAQKVVRVLSAHVAAAQAETAVAMGTPEGTGWLQPLTSTWSRTAIAAVLVPALILLIVVLL